MVGPLVRFLDRESSGHGVPEVLDALASRGGRMRGRTVIMKALTSAVTIGTGGSAGREGPMVQVGAGVGSVAGQWLGLPEGRLRTLVAAGAAAGIGATFNAPIAGVLFAVEVLLGEVSVKAFTPVVVASVIATVVSHRFWGDVPVFHAGAVFRLESVAELPIHAALGVLAGLASVGFIWILARCEDLFEQIPGPAWLKPAIGGLMVGAIGLAAPEVLGVGYEAMDLSIFGAFSLGGFLLLMAGKAVATSLSLGSGGSGGVFAPALFTGGMLGGAVGVTASAVLPAGCAAPVGAYVLVGMAGLVAGTVHAPITAILLLYEMSGDHRIILPLMLTCVLAAVTARRLKGDSIYTEKLTRRGIHVLAGRDAGVRGPSASRPACPPKCGSCPRACRSGRWSRRCSRARSTCSPWSTPRASHAAPSCSKK